MPGTPLASVGALPPAPQPASSMRTPIPLLTLLVCTLLLALPAASARANNADNRIIQDCQNSETGALGGSYTKPQLRHALRNLPGDVLEYSGCYDQIRQAMLASSGGETHGSGNAGTGGIGGGDGSNGGGTGGTGDFGDGTGGTGSTGGPAPQPPAGAEAPVAVAGTTVAPGALPEIGRDAHRLPTALLVLLGLLGVAALAAAALTIGRRVVTHRSA